MEGGGGLWGKKRISPPHRQGYIADVGIYVYGVGDESCGGFFVNPVRVPVSHV
jgi:hypothetical protein